MTQRISYLDTAKFFAILFIVLGHCGTMFYGVVYSFHVQLFFIVAGMVFTCGFDKYNQFFTTGLRKLFYRIILPYFLFSFFYCSSFDIKTVLYVLYGSDQSVRLASSAFLWYLPCYVSTICIYNLIEVTINKFHLDKTIINIIAIVIFSIIAAYTQFNQNLCISILGRDFYLTGIHQLSNSTDIGFPFCCNIACSGVVFMYIGSLLSKATNKLALSAPPYKAIIALTAIIIFGTLGFFSYKANQNYIPSSWNYHVIAMSFAVYGKYIYFLITSVSFSIVIIMVSMLVDNNFFSYIGKATLGIYFVHKFIGASLSMILGKIGVTLGGDVLGIVVLLLSLVMVIIIRKSCPLLIGEGKCTNCKDK